MGNRSRLIGALVGILLPSLGAMTSAQEAPAPKRPNILWITCEDISPNLGCYGDRYAVTPNLDRLAKQSVRYTRAFAPIGVCAPARSSLILGMYAPSVGSQHMRCQATLPPWLRCFPSYLREAGYHCTNNVKTDYNFKAPEGTWDASSNRAHWRNRKPGQPFFAVFNFTTCHESQIRLPENQYQDRIKDFKPSEIHDPAHAPLPPYHPDTPEVRRDWARYADMITYMDRQCGEILAQLEADGLAEDTIVFYFSDHGAGMPRSKRWLYDSSTRVPLLVRFPTAYQKLAPGAPGSTTDRLVSFVDFGPTVLSLAGVNVPKHMQGTPFLGPQAGEPRQYVYGFRDRMDERTDLLRSVRDARYKYIRNYHPERPWFHDQFISYMYEMPTMQVWQRLADEGKLTGAAAAFMATSKPVEELYDTEDDPWEIHNLAGAPEHQDRLVRFRAALRSWQEEIRDLGLLPEADLRSRFGAEAPYDAVRRDPGLYPIRRIAEAADVANRLDGRDPFTRLETCLHDPDPAVRYWGAVGLGLGADPQRQAASPLIPALKDPAPWVRVAAADALVRTGHTEPALPVLIAALSDPNEWVRLQAIQTIDRLHDQPRAALPALRDAAGDPNEYVVRVARHALSAVTGSR